MYRTTITIRVYTDNPYDPQSIQDIANEIEWNGGDGVITNVASVAVASREEEEEGALQPGEETTLARFVQYVLSTDHPQISQFLRSDKRVVWVGLRNDRQEIILHQFFLYDGQEQIGSAQTMHRYGDTVLPGMAAIISAGVPAHLSIGRVS